MGVLNSSKKQCLFHHDFLVTPGSGKGSGACLTTFLFRLLEMILFHHDFLVPFGFRCLSSFLSLSPSLSFFPLLRKGAAKEFSITTDDLRGSMGSCCLGSVLM